MKSKNKCKSLCGPLFLQELMIVMDFGGDFLKLIALGAGPCCGATTGTFGLTAS
jgi:hypothetical protein